MKRIILLATMLCCSYGLQAQKTVKLNNLWTKPQVHVLFQGYTLSFKIKDIDRALVLMDGIGDPSFGATSGLDTLVNYNTELFPGTRTLYRNKLQPLMQKGVGAFLLLAGQAQVVNHKNKKLKEIIADVQPVKMDDSFAYINFYDPRNNNLIFSGSMNVGMYGQDLGIE
ncbi:MAG: hypothetical protein K9G49_00910 [Taibaiella sp.]|nr:hypothetical protein [Taibaiella sp.]